MNAIIMNIYHVIHTAYGQERSDCLSLARSPCHASFGSWLINQMSSFPIASYKHLNVCLVSQMDDRMDTPLPPTVLNPRPLAQKKEAATMPVEFEAFVQIDSPRKKTRTNEKRIEIHPMNFKIKSLSTAMWPLKFHFISPLEARTESGWNMCKL